MATTIVKLSKQFEQSLRNTLGLLMLFTLILIVFASYYIASNLNEREQSLHALTYALKPLLAQFDIADLDSVIVQVIEKKGMRHTRSVVVNNYPDNTRASLKRKNDLIHPLSTIDHSTSRKSDVWPRWGKNQILFSAEIALFLLVISCVTFASVWLSTRRVLVQKILLPMQQLHAKVNRSHDTDQLANSTDLGSVELNELQESFCSSLKGIRDLADTRSAALNSQRVAAAMIDKAFCEAGISISYALEDGEAAIVHGASSPTKLCDIWKLRHQPITSLIESLEKSGFECQNIGAKSEQHLDGSKTTRLSFSLHLFDEESRGWNVHGVELGLHSFAIIIVDVAEQKAFENRRSQNYTIDALDVIVRGVAHDVNNMLATISGALELETIGYGTDKNIQTALHACRRGAVLVQQLLHISREKSPKMALIDQHEALHDLLQLLPATLGPQYELVVSIGPDNPIKADRDLLETTLVNFISNAREAMPHGGKIQLISRVADQKDLIAANLASDTAYVAFDVIDEGSGIAAEIREKMFDPLYTTRSAGKGAGLGLSIAQSFITRAGGSILVKDRTDRSGSIFSIYLPMAEPTIGPPPKETSKVPAIAILDLSINLLLVEDELALADTTSQYLTYLGINHECAHSYDQAIKLLKRSSNVKFDILLVDMLLPDGSGIEILKCRSDLGGIYFGALASGNLQVSLLSQREQQLFDEFLQKPYSFMQLNKTLQRAAKYLMKGSR